MTFIQKTFFTAVLAFLPFAVEAAAPANISHIEARLTSGELIVQWSAPNNGADIAFYRVYYSHESILENDGNYDDAEKTTGPETTFVFQKLPLQSKKIFVAVLAVNSAGNESEGFEAEASVDVPTQAPSSSSSVASSVSSSTESVQEISHSGSTTSLPMSITSAKAVSQTGVLIMFSKPVSKTIFFANTTFIITDASGAILDITRIEGSGGNLVIHTTSQNSAKMYILQLLQPIAADDGTNVGTTAPAVQFDGYGKQEIQETFSSSSASLVRNLTPGQTSSSASTAAIPPLPQDPQNLELIPTLNRNGKYDVLAQWTNNNPHKNLASYLLSVSTDGQRFDPSAEIAPTETSAQYKNISPGMFGVRMVAKDFNSVHSGGIEKVIRLPDSGLGLFGILAASGFVAGSRAKRRKAAKTC